jgi:hypothetical protein
VADTTVTIQSSPTCAGVPDATGFSRVPTSLPAEAVVVGASAVELVAEGAVTVPVVGVDSGTAATAFVVVSVDVAPHAVTTRAKPTRDTKRPRIGIPSVRNSRKTAA